MLIVGDYVGHPSHIGRKMCLYLLKQPFPIYLIIRFGISSSFRYFGTFR